MKKTLYLLAGVSVLGLTVSAQTRPAAPAQADVKVEKIVVEAKEAAADARANAEAAKPENQQNVRDARIERPERVELSLIHI